ncbi:MAG TPA: VWA domain-containing protein, partial [Burkholderiaceae bacterium]
MLNTATPGRGRAFNGTPMAALDSRAADRLAGFPTFLRANGFAVGGGDAVQVLRIAQRVGVLDPHVLRWSLQALLCGRGDEWRRFPDLFDAWFLPANRWQKPERRDASDGVMPDERAAESGAANTAADDDNAAPRRAASREAVLSSTDFRALTEREHALDIEALMRRLARQLKPIRLRRRAQASAGRQLDLPSTIRRSVASGGTPFRLAWRDRRRVRPRLVLLID